MKNILYLHGFASSSDSTKAKLFKEFVNSHKNLNVLTPDLPNNLIGWSKLIEELCEKHNPVAFIGSSMGGFYSTFYARKLGAMDVLLNPAVLPAEGMKSYLGKNNNYATGEEFIMKNDEIAITCGTIRTNVTDIKTNRRIASFELQDKVLSLALSKDEEYLFAADSDSVEVYYTGNWANLCEIKAKFIDFEIGNLMLSEDNMYLVVSDQKQGRDKE